MDPWFEPGNRRAILHEIRHMIETMTGATPVTGFSDMICSGDALFNNDSLSRVSGFAEDAVRREWLLSLSAQKGMVWSTRPVPKDSVSAVVFVLDMGFGNGSPLPQPTGAWQLLINGHRAVVIRGVNHSQLWQGDACSFAFSANRIETAPPYCSLHLSDILTSESIAAFGPALLKVPTDWLERGKPATIAIEPISNVPSTRWIRIGSCAGMVLATDIWAAVDVLQNRRPKLGDYRVFFGDIHTHSGQMKDKCDNSGCGMGSRVENYEYARGPGALDFFALTDHDWQIDPNKPDEYFSLADRYNEDGRFVCLPGFEYTSLLYGHRNVYFRDSGAAIFSPSRSWGPPTIDPEQCTTPHELWDAMETTGIPFITVPHHPSSTSHPLNLNLHDPRYDRLYEIYSCWGSSEYYGDSPRGVSDRLRSGDFHDAVRRGLRLGVIASSDGHDAHPGNAQSPLTKHHHIFHYCGSGRAAVLAEELTRHAVFDALYARRCYATTGTPIVLDFTVCGAVMGSEIPSLRPGRVPQLRFSCTGSNGLDHVRVVKNGQIVHTIPCHGQRSIQGEWEDGHYEPGSSSCYYVRVVQVDRESAWSSPVWVG